MAILDEIAHGAVDSRIPLHDLLRKCLVLASKLKNEELRKWVNNELNGYPTEADLPPYRIITAHAKGHIFGPGGAGYRNAPISPSMLPEKLRHFATTANITQAIGTLVEMADTDEAEFQLPWPPDLVQFVRVADSFACVQGWQAIPRGAIIAIVEAVRNRLLEFVLRLQEEIPGLDIDNPSPAAAQVIDRSISTIIHGNVIGNVAVASEGITQITSADVRQNDFESLRTFLAGLGIQDSDIASLKTDLDQDRAEAGKPTIGKRTGRWLGDIIAKASLGTLKIGAQVAATVLIKAIAAYLGIPIP